MDIFWTLILFLIGFGFLLKGAQILVRGAIAITKLFGVSPWVIGMLVVGIGTSIPELSINIASAIRGVPIGVGAIIGSNTFNTLFILGVSAMIAPCVLKREWVSRDLVFNMFSILLAWLLAFFPILGDRGFVGITRPEGFVLLGAFLLWVWALLKKTDKEGSRPDDSVAITLWSAVFMLAIGFVGVLLGGRWVVDGAVVLAQVLGAGETFISIAIIGVGTSLPELTISVSALFQKRTGLAIGNIIGSNIFDFLGILGIASLFGPIVVLPGMKIDMMVALVATTMLFIAMFFGRKFVLERREGFVFVLVYLAYFTFLFIKIAA